MPPDTSQAKLYIHVHLGKIRTKDFNHLKFNISDGKLLLYLQNVHSYSFTPSLCRFVSYILDLPTQTVFAISEDKISGTHSHYTLKTYIIYIKKVIINFF